MKLISLSDDSAVSDKLFTEHGLCFYIEQGGAKILFGTGASALFMSNAERLGVPAKQADFVVLPANRSELTGGVEPLMKLNPQARLFISLPAATDTTEKRGLLKVKTGLSSSFFKSEKHDTVRFDRFCEVCKDFFLVRRETPFSQSVEGEKRFVRRNGTYIPDDGLGEAFAVCFPDSRRREMVILTDCAADGAVLAVKTAKAMWDVPVGALIGGFGFTGAGKTASVTLAEKTARELSKLNIGYIYACHTTGVKGCETMKQMLGDQIQYLHAGEELDF